MKKGFTLVELSIALVIIGLLVGGILVGQSLINSAAINKTISMVAQFDATALNYKTQFKYLPGDNPNEKPIDTMDWGTCAVPLGLGNGIIDSGCFVGNYVTSHYYGGLRQFWYIMSSRKLLAPTVPPSGASSSYFTSGPKRTAYKAPIGENDDTAFWVGCLAVSGNCNTSKDNYYAIIKILRTANYHTTSGTGAVKPADALAIDKKLDDGIANSGNVQSGNESTGIVKTSVSENCSVGATYTLTDPDYECVPIIRLGAQVGQLQ